MSEERHSTLSEKITAAATVATAVAAAEAAAEAAKSRQEMEAMNAAMKRAAARQERIQLEIAEQQAAMAAEQAEHNFRNTVLATLPLLKSEDEKVQYLTEQMLPKLKQKVKVRIVRPFKATFLAVQRENQLQKYLESEAGQELKSFLSAGNVLGTRLDEWDAKSRKRVKQAEELKEAQASFSAAEPFGFVDVVKIGVWAFLFFIVLEIFRELLLESQDETTQKIINEDVPFGFIILAASMVLGVIIHLSRKHRKIRRLKGKVQSLSLMDDGSALTKEKQELDRKSKLQNEKWEVFKPQVVKYIMEKSKHFITSDPHSEILNGVTAQIENYVRDAQSFLPPSARLPVGHYAQYFFDEKDVENFREGQSTVENRLKTTLKPDYQNQTIVLEKDNDKATDSSQTQSPITQAEAPTVEEIVARHGAGIEDSKIWFTPNIPTNKLRGAIRSYAQSISPSDVLLLVDNTFWGGCGDGMLITRDRLYAHDMGESPKVMKISEIKTVNISSGFFSNGLIINDIKFTTFNLPNTQSRTKLYRLVTELASGQAIGKS